jgi:hypothetical protein
VKEFIYLGSMFTREGKCDSDIERRRHWGSFREGPGQEYTKPASVYEEFDNSGRSERCVRIVASGRK